MVGREANKVPSGDTGESQSQASHLETTKPRAGGVAQRLPGPEGRRRGRRRGLGHEPQRAGGGRAGGRESPAPSVPGPWLRAWRRARAPPHRCPGGEPTRRGLQVPGSPEAGAGRSLAQFPGIRRAGKRRGGRSGRRAGSAREAGRGRRRGRRGPESCVPGRGPAGLAALGAGSAACTAPAARSRLGGRRTAGSAQGPQRAEQRSTQRADPHRARAPGAARPLPGGRPSAPELGARRLPGL